MTFLLNDSLQKIEKRFDVAYPDLASFVPTKDDLFLIQQKLDSHQLFVEFFYGYDNVYVLAVSKRYVKQYWIPMDSCSIIIERFQKSFTMRTTDQYIRDAKSLFQLFVSPAINSISDSITSIVFIMDGPLHFIPIEALRDEEDSLLIKKYSISYDISGQMWLKREPNDQADHLYSFAPNYETKLVVVPDSLQNSMLATLLRDANYRLPGARREADQIAIGWNGKSIVGKKANKEYFIETIASANVVHLAMHTLIDEKDYYNSHLKFGDDVGEELSLSELSRLNIQTNLVTLSACNTGQGQTFRGYGTKSLARGFLASGAKSVVMSLWRVSDKSTSKIIIAFYEHLKTGLSRLGHFIKNFTFQRIKWQLLVLSRIHCDLYPIYLLHSNNSCIRH